LISGPFSAGDSGIVKTDIAGNIVAWSLTGSLPGLDMLSQGAMDGSGRDLVFGDKPGACGPPGQLSGACSAEVDYGSGPHPPGTGWIVAVPEPPLPILLLIGLAGVVLLALQVKRSEDVECFRRDVTSFKRSSHPYFKDL